MSDFEMKRLYTLPIEKIDPLYRIGTFRGYASTFDNVDKANDVILKGAFEDTLSKRENGFPNIYLEHNLYHCVGTCNDAGEDQNGLYIEGVLFVQYIQKAAEVYKALQSGMKYSLSIGFYVKKSVTKDGIRYIQKADLAEISIVRNPCNPKAQIQEFKRDHDPTHSDDLDSTHQKIVEEIRSLTARLKR